MSSGAGPTPSASIEGGAVDTKAAPGAIANAEARAADAAKNATIALQLDKKQLDGDHYVAPLRDGRRAILTLDPDLQKLAEKLLDQSRAPRAAIVAMTPDGRILALAGRRTADPKGGKDGTFDYHVATEVWAPAASVFKLVTASALLSHGYDADSKVCYHGGIRSVMESNLADDKRDNACATLGYGVAHSNNAILGKLAYQNLEPELLDREARDLGWTRSPAFGIEATCGELALPTHKDLEFAQSAAGFNGSRLSVLGGALLSATFAADGEQPVPRIIESIDGKPYPKAKPRRVLPAKVAREVAKMMVGTCESGSAAKSFRRHKTVDVAGKTGTLTTTEPFYMQNSWFVGFAPVEDPDIVVSVLLGNPESWYLRGHEAAKSMIDRAIRRAEDRADDKEKKSSARPSKRHR